MASVVSCPGCRKRLRIGTDKPGGKLRCPACNTPFVVGARINEGSRGAAEFQAFELFEENIVTDTFTIEEERPTVKPPPKQPAPTKVAGPPPAPRPAPKPADVPVDDDRTLVLFDLDVPRPSKLGPFPPTEPVLPDDVRLIEDPPPAPPPPPKPPAPPVRPAPKPVPSHSEKTASKSDFRLEPAVERKSAVRPAPAPPPPAPAEPADFFLPADFDPFAGATAAPDLSLDDGLPRLKEEPPPVYADFEVVEGGAEVVAPPARPTAGDRDIAGRGPRREQRRAHARTARVHEDVRGRWVIVHWGLTVELIALGLLVAAMLLSLLGGVLVILMRSPAGLGVGSVLSLISFGLLAFREVLVMLGYGLSIAAPARNNAWIWAVLALAFALAATFAHVGSLIIPLAVLAGIPLSLASWFCYLIFLKTVGDALKLHYIAEATLDVMKLVGLQFMLVLLFWGGMFGLALALGRPKQPADLVGVGLIFLVCGGVFLVISLLVSAAIIYKYYFVLMNLREEIGWRLEA